MKTANLQALLGEDDTQSAIELLKQLGVNISTIDRRLHSMEKIQKVGKRVLHELSERNVEQRLNTCIS